MAPGPRQIPRFSSSFAVVLSNGLAIETTYGLSIVSEGRPITVRSVEEKLVHKKFPGKTPEIPLDEIPWDREAMKQWPSARELSEPESLQRLEYAVYLAKFLGSIGQKIWCLTFHSYQNPTDFGWRPAPAHHSGVAQGTTWRLCRR